MNHDFGFLFDAQVNLDAADGDTSSSWVQIAKTGTFNDPRYGEFKITRSDFKKWMANFESLVLEKGRLGLPADVDHSPEKRGDTEAVGWVKQLDARGDELWARVEWNTLGRELIEEKRYAYISPSYSGHYKDETGKDHGTALVGIALTNRPFLQMATVNLSEFTFARHVKPANQGDDVGLNPDDVTDLDYSSGGDNDGDAQDSMEAIAPHILDISDPERQAHAVVVKKINGNTKHMFPIPPGDKLHARLALEFVGRSESAGHITSQEAASIRSRAHEVLGDKGTKQHAAYSHPQMELTTILTALNLSADADEATVLSAIETMRKPSVPEGHVVLSQDTVAKLTSDAAAGARAAEELRVNKFDTAFLDAQKAGKVTLGQKDDFRSMYDLNGDTALKILDGLQPSVNMAPAGVGGSAADLDPAAHALASKYTDTVTPMGVDAQGLRVLARAEEIEVANKVPFAQALRMAEQELGA